MVQTSSSGRIVTLVAVSQGTVNYAVAGATSWTASSVSGVTNPVLATTGVVMSAPNTGKLYFCDGVQGDYVYFDPSTTTTYAWTASSGTLPVDGSNNAARLIELWRGRTLLSGILGTPQDIYMSAVADATNWNISPANTVATQAVTLSATPTGKVGDVVTGMVPYTDDVLIIGCDHEIWRLTGDPMSGGQLDCISKSIGMAWGRAWCMDPYGTIYFVSNKTGIYMLIPGEAPQRISQQIEQLLLPINTGANTFRLIWDDRFQGLHVFCTATAAAGPATHFFYEKRTGAWWTDSFGNNNHNPLTVCVFDGNTPGDRLSLIGSWDGFVRSIDPTATTDDGTNISSAVLLGPILAPTFDDMLVKDIQGVLGSGTGNAAVTWTIYVGATAEQAISAGAWMTGTWSGGRNLTSYVRAAGHAVFVKLSSTSQWAMEGIRARISSTGKVRQRGV